VDEEDSHALSLRDGQPLGNLAAAPHIQATRTDTD
jgi:hypothetical protein